MKYNHAMAEREYKREWKAAKLEMRKAGMQRKQIREAARAYRLEFNGERRFYRRTDVVPACEREDRPPKGVDTLFKKVIRCIHLIWKMILASLSIRLNAPTAFPG